MIDQDFKDHVKTIKRGLAEKAGAIGIYRFTIENPDGSKEAKYYHNILTTAFFEMIMDNLVSAVPTDDMLFSHVALGSDDTAVAEGDTTLGTEVYRNTVASMTYADNICYVAAFFDQTETDGTYKEAGIFSNGTASVDTGVLGSHVNIDVTKSTIQKLTIDWMLTLTNA